MSKGIREHSFRNQWSDNILLSEKLRLFRFGKALNEFAVLDKHSYHKGIELNRVEFLNNPLYHTDFAILADMADHPINTAQNEDEIPNHLLTDSHAFPMSALPMALTDISAKGKANNRDTQAGIPTCR